MSEAVRTVEQNAGAALVATAQSSRVVRVLHVHAGNMYGGVEAMLLAQVRHRELCPELETSFALCFEGRFSDAVRANGATVNMLGTVRLRQPLSVRVARRNLKELLRRESFDVVVMHSSWSHGIFARVVKDMKLPLVFYMHSPPAGRHWLERLARRTKPDLILCNSNYTAASAGKLFSGIRTQTVYCPVSLRETQFSKTEIAQTRAELETPDDAVVIIQVSRMESLKGHARHLKALKLLKDIPNWVCWQVGGPQRAEEFEYFDSLRALAAELGIQERVRFVGQRTDVNRLLAASDIYCQPNTSPDSFGISLVEALHFGLPVVTTAIGGAAEIVDETCGVLVFTGDATSLSRTLRKLIDDNDSRKQLGTNGPARALALCDPANQINRFHETIQALLQVKN